MNGDVLAVSGAIFDRGLPTDLELAFHSAVDGLAFLTPLDVQRNGRGPTLFSPIVTGCWGRPTWAAGPFAEEATVKHTTKRAARLRAVRDRVDSFDSISTGAEKTARLKRIVPGFGESANLF